MKRVVGESKAGKKLVKRVHCALSDDELSEEDIALLQSICPPEARDDWERIIVHFQKEFTFLKTLFRFYALQGTEGSEAVESMGKNNFASYAQEIAVTEKRSLNLNAGSIDLIFIRSNQDRAEGVDYFDRNNMGKALKAQKGARGTNPIDNEMGLREFV